MKGHHSPPSAFKAGRDVAGSQIFLDINKFIHNLSLSILILNALGKVEIRIFDEPLYERTSIVYDIKVHLQMLQKFYSRT